MSLLEDIFLQDEANEAQELERVIEGDEYDDRPRSVASNSDENSAKEDEAEEDKRRVDPTKVKTKRIIKHPRFVLNPARLTGPRGIEVIPDHFKDFKFRGKGHEKEDLDLVLKKLEHWAYRLYPKFGFEDCIKKIETLGKKRPVAVHLQKIRSDQLQLAETVVQKDSSDEEDAPPQEEDEFDKLLQQQIDLSRVTPAPDSARKPITTPRQVMSPFAMPRATSSPSISDEQKERMLRNRKLAEERRLARLKQNTNEKSDVGITKLNTLHERLSNEHEHESSDEEINVNVPVTVDINTSNRGVENDSKDNDRTINGFEQDKDVPEINVENTNKTLDVSEETEKLNYDDEIMHDNEQQNNDELNTENTDNYRITENISKNINNTRLHEIINVSRDVEKVTDEISNSEEVETIQRADIANDVDTVIENVKDTELETEGDENESVIEDKANAPSSEVSPKKVEKLERKTDAIERSNDLNSDINQLVENELMDVDFDEEF